MAVYIALEGPDGVGKSTVAAALRGLLQPRSAVRIRHFPTDVLTACAQIENRRLTAGDYAMDMEDWLSSRPEPVLFPDTPTPASNGGQLYILDRWALSTSVYASLRGEKISGDVALTLNWLNRVPLATFVLMPRDPAELTDPDYPDPDGYDPVPVAEAYRRFLTDAFIPVVVDRTVDTPGSVAAEIAEWVTGLQRGM